MMVYGTEPIKLLEFGRLITCRHVKAINPLCTGLKSTRVNSVMVYGTEPY